MTRNVAFFADGTWSDPGKGDGPDESLNVTNVLKLFANVAGFPTIETLQLQNEQDRVARDAKGQVVQIAKYLHGVGDSRNPFARVLGCSFGAGVMQRIVRGYTFISRYAEPGDRIYLVGFSRGAYTARALGGLIANVGLLNASALGGLRDKELAYRYGMSAWMQYRVKAGFEPDLLDRWTFGKAVPIPAGALHDDVDITAIGVWDTVGALGIPRYSKQKRLDVFRFADNRLNAKVQRGFHAVAIDEQRADFEPTLWERRNDGTIEEVWFAGAHGDVGGGYPNAESGLANASLGWMAERLADAGLLIDPCGAYQPDPAADAMLHRPWDSGLWQGLPRFARPLNTACRFHSSVQQRIARDPGYAGGAIGPLLVEGALPPAFLA